MLKRTTEEVRTYFEERGCKLLSEYFGAQKPMRYKCKCGRESITNYNHFSHGKRCGYCGTNGRTKKYSLEEVKDIFTKRGCEMLDDIYVNGHTHINYQCVCSRKAKITLMAFVHQNQTCFQCGVDKHRGAGNHEWKPDRVKHREDQLFRKKCYKALRSTLESVGQEKVGRTTDMLGYGPKELQEYITQHPKWESVKDQNWHLDHIFPITAFLDHGIRDIKLINALENLQPMIGSENISKGDGYDKLHFQEWMADKYIPI